MPDNDFLKKTLDHYRQQRDTLLSQLRNIEAMIANLETELNEPPTVDAPSTVTVNYDAVLEARLAPTRPVSIQPDDFYGMTQTQAAKTYLQRVKRAVAIDQLVDALKSGGAQLGGADPKKTLYVSLARNPEREFVFPREGYIGLREFYPNLPKMSSKAKGKKKPNRSHVVKQPVKKAKAATSAPKGAAEKPVKTAVLKALADGHSATFEDIVVSVCKQLGRTVSAFGVRATLRGKEFAREGDKYKKA
jgi:hypothetical protein